MESLSGKILSLVTAAAGLLLLFACSTPAAAQSQSPVKDVFLTEIDVTGVNSSAGLPGHGILDGLAHWSGKAIEPVLMICAQENVNANGNPNDSCSPRDDGNTCVHTYNCKAILHPPLPLTSEDATVAVTIWDVAVPGQQAMNSQFDIPMVGQYDSTALTGGKQTFVPQGYPGTMVTVVLHSDYTKLIGTAAKVIKNVAKRKPGLPTPSPADFGAGAANELTKENLGFDRCLGSHTTSSSLSAQQITARCGNPGDPGFRSCVEMNFPSDSAQAACLTDGSMSKILQPLNTGSEAVKSFVCGLFAWVPNAWTPDSIAQKCNPGVPAGAGAAHVPAQTETPYDTCLRNAINNYPDLSQQANASGTGCYTKTGNARTTCLENILAPPLDVSKPTPKNFSARSQQFADCQIKNKVN